MSAEVLLPTFPKEDLTVDASGVSSSANSTAVDRTAIGSGDINNNSSSAAGRSTSGTRAAGASGAAGGSSVMIGGGSVKQVSSSVGLDGAQPTNSIPPTRNNSVLLPSVGSHGSLIPRRGTDASVATKHTGNGSGGGLTRNATGSIINRRISTALNGDNDASLSTTYDRDVKRREDLLQVVRNKKRRPRIDQVLSSHTFAQEHSNALVVPALYRRPLVTLERLDTVCVSMECLFRLCGLPMPHKTLNGSKTSCGVHSPNTTKLNDFRRSASRTDVTGGSEAISRIESTIASTGGAGGGGWTSSDDDDDDNLNTKMGQQRSNAAAQLGLSVVLYTKLRSKLRYLGRIYDQLNEDPNEFHSNVRFAPGKVVEEIDSIIAIKASELAAAKDQLLTDFPANLRLCERFLRGHCTRGITCQDSHTNESLLGYMRTYLTEMYVSALDANDDLEFGKPETWMEVGGKVPAATATVGKVQPSSINSNSLPPQTQTSGGGTLRRKTSVAKKPQSPKRNSLSNSSSPVSTSLKNPRSVDPSQNQQQRRPFRSGSQSSDHPASPSTKPFVSGGGTEVSSDEDDSYDLDEEALNRKERYRLSMVLTISESFGPEATMALLHELHLHQTVQWKAHLEHKDSQNGSGGGGVLDGGLGATRSLRGSLASITPLMRRGTIARLHKLEGSNTDDGSGASGGGGDDETVGKVRPVTTFKDYPPFTSIVFRNFNTSTVKCLRTLTDLIKTNALPFVHHMDLSQNALGSAVPQGVLRLAKAILFNETIRSLGLSYNHLGNAGVLALLQSLDQNDTLRSLDIGSNGLNPHETSFEHICKYLHRNPISGLRKLSLSGNAKLGSLGIKCLGNVLSQNDFIFITHLDLYRCDLGDGGCRTLSYFLRSSTGCGSLIRLLDLGWNGITSDGIASLTHALQGPIIAPGASSSSPAAATSPSPGSVLLTPQATGINNNVNNSSPMSPGTVGGDVGDDPFNNTANTPSAQSLMMSPNARSVGGGGGVQSQDQVGHTCLQVLRLHGNPAIGRKGALMLASFLKHSAPYMPLTRVDLRWTTPTDDGVASIADAVQYCPLLLDVDVGGNDLDARTEALLSERLTVLAQNRSGQQQQGNNTAAPAGAGGTGVGGVPPASGLKTGTSATSGATPTNAGGAGGAGGAAAPTRASKSIPLSIEQVLHPAEIVTPRDMLF